MDFALLVVIVILALAFDYVNGFHDAANAIATVVSSKALSPRAAVVYGAVLNFVGAFMGTEVAATIGKGLVDLPHTSTMSLEVIMFALIGGIVWNFATWYLGLPTSSSHALIGSLLGAVYFTPGSGMSNIHIEKIVQKVVQPMIASPLIGITVGFLVMALLAWVCHKLHLSWINKIFKKLQLLSSGFLALSHGTNDAQKSMGIIALALITYSQAHGGGAGGHFEVPFWVKASCALMMGLGTLTGGWKIIRTLSKKMIRLQPIYGFAAEVTSGTIIHTASHFGLPLSTTQAISSAIMGVGATKRLSAVKWGVVKNILWAWVLTIPCTFLFSGILTLIYFKLVH